MNFLDAPFKWATNTYFGFIVRDIGIDWCEHIATFAAGNTQINANIRFQAHATTIQ